MTATTDPYASFVTSKAALAEPAGFDCSPDDVHPSLFPHQRDAVRWAVARGRAALFESFGLGKAQPVDEPVLTPTGWRAIGDLAVGDQVVTVDGTPTWVTGVFPQGERPIVRVTMNDGAWTRCDADHLWTVANGDTLHRGRPWRTLTTTDLKVRGLREGGGRRARWRIPVVSAVAHATANVPIDPYILGVLLGDGSFRNDVALQFTSADPEIAAEVKSRLPDGMRLTDLTASSSPRVGLYRLVVAGHTNWNRRNPFLAATREWGLAGRLAHEKFVPAEYLTADPAQRMDLLRGLMDTDGYAAKDGTVQFGTSSPQLADDVAELVRSLGGIARRTNKQPTYRYANERRTGRTHWTLTIAMPDGQVPFLLRRKAERCHDRYWQPQRKIVSIEPDGTADAVCIAVEHPSHLYVTRDHIVTHNTVQQLETVRITLEKAGGSRGLIVCPLGVRQEFIGPDAERLGLEPRFVRRDSEVRGDGIYVTNYESIREGKLNPRGFTAVSLDEAAVLRGAGGSKTFRELMRLYEGTADYRFVATATPSPNEFIELLTYSAFLDILDIGQAKTRFFKRDSTHADRLTLLPNMEREFWLWCASWALFLQSPADLGHDATGYELPPLDVRWHEVPSEPADGETDRSGRGVLFRDAALGVTQAAQEKRASMSARVAKAAELVAESPGDHFLLWHDLEDERRAIDAAVPGSAAVWGTQDLDERERRIVAFANGEIPILSTKPIIAGAGCNFQRHCHREIFAGIGFKFYEFIQAIHRTYRFLQTEPVRIDLIYTEAERAVRGQLERKWRQHDEMVSKMSEIIRTYRLSHEALAGTLARATTVERVVAEGESYRLVNNDTVLETQAMPDDSVGLIVSSIPFSTQYEYTPSVYDFGYTEDNDEFWRQMDHLTPELLRVLQPGRVAAIHVKDRIAPGGLTGLGFQTVQPFSDECQAHFRKHGFAYIGRKTIVTDVVRENNQTYRLGWTEQCKDGSRMGVGMSEYIMLFRKRQSDPARGYADIPVVKDKDAYSRSRWQVDAHGFARSNGDRPLTPEDLSGIPHERIFKLFRQRCLGGVYDFEEHVRLAEALEADGRLPTTFMLLQPASWHPDVWTDVARMRTLNMNQERSGLVQHCCPLQFDIVDRLVEQFSMPDEIVYDPFGGIMTVPYCSVKKGRIGWATELNPGYFADGLAYVDAAARAHAVPTLFDLIATEDELIEETA